MYTSRLAPLYLVALTLVAACPGGSGPVAPPSPPPASAASVTILPDGLTLFVGGQGTLAADVRDVSNAPLATAVSWRSLSSAIASVSASGQVTGNAVGSALVIAAAGTKADTVLIVVLAAGAFTLEVVPAAANVSIGGTQQFSVIARNAAGHVITVGTPVWTAGTPAVAFMVAGLAAGLSVGNSTITARVGTVSSLPALFTVRANALPCDGVEMTPHWQVSFDFSYARALTNGDNQQVSISHSGTVTANLLPIFGQLPASQWEGNLAGSVSMNDRLTSPGSPPSVETFVGTGAPVTGTGRSVFILTVDTDNCTFTASLNPFDHITHTSNAGVETGDLALDVIQLADPLGSWRSLGMANLGGSFDAHYFLAANRTGKDTFYPYGVGLLLWAHNGSPDAPLGAASVSYTILAR